MIVAAVLWAQILCSVIVITPAKAESSYARTIVFWGVPAHSKGGEMEKGTHQHVVAAWQTSGRTGTAKCVRVPNPLHFSAPSQFGGLEGRWTPEDLMLAAVASCYTSTFRALADYSKFKYADLEVEVTGTIHKIDSGYSFGEIVTRPALTIVREWDHERAVRLLQKTQELCLVARALSVKHRFEPRIVVADKSGAWGLGDGR
jgi:organic hydroperoxide reductase OsmC/OhrA